MQTYLVGGAVRDRLLGLPTQDHDWVVVGGTPQAMLDAGYTAVGKDFPVFLHPQTHEEYALARTERKTGQGYTGFAVHAAPDVTLEDDLARRDLTINAIAAELPWLDEGAPAGSARLIDPYGGQRDLAAKVLRHVTDAFREDPVRILRVARFAARYADFSVAPDTLALMREMVAAGEVDHLVPERVWQELARGLMEARPSRMFAVLRDCGALQVLMPELDRLWGVPQPPAHHPEVDTGVHVMMVIDQAAALQAPLTVRFAGLMHDLGKSTTDPALLPKHHLHELRSVDLLLPLCERLKVPVACRDLAELVAREHTSVHRSLEAKPASIVRLLERSDAIRKPARFRDALWACECDARGRLGLADRAYPQRAYLNALLDALLALDTAPIARAALAKGLRGPQIGEQIHSARVDAVRAAMPGAAPA
ncbi:multifunctional CCA tRNA nucleotidyl transferase/2'3'-cyclic phosphodiesterase/2'nucleotidase/phosphatase [Comamonas serinivorans]|uniref:Multifunctional CCA protein n=1 Tax=Comamonas serinivorans TaxID=1082851 RepID=A0A1Y0ERX5_9BURK|nr:multifunctional CCA addition/repair protein [Comamonas serinivorans]ARU06353.1 multifunctional CCA tRNA nucleotidyl transferase/2'3'-cyclic phosphodiesterase/2'nucleotidase/phosphatase [Comamonas serinivorans]